ncbi:MAG: hypothetical protein ABL933_14675, partial [Methyloglobulus sp.]
FQQFDLYETKKSKVILKLKIDGFLEGIKISSNCTHARRGNDAEHNYARRTLRHKRHSAFHPDQA